MKIKFLLPRISGLELSVCFQAEGATSEDMWVTALSGFTYMILNATAGEPAVVEFDGAENGFRQQDLLPAVLKAGSDALEEGIEIVSVEGTYGKFSGPEAFRVYKEKKRRWYSLCHPIFEISEGTLFDTSGHAFGEFCASLWRIRQKADEGVVPQPPIC